MMDCGAWKLEEETRSDVVVRLRGSEYELSWEDLNEFVFHLSNVVQGAVESLSNDYKDLPSPTPTTPTGSLLDLLGLRREPNIRRRV